MQNRISSVATRCPVAAHVWDSLPFHEAVHWGEATRAVHPQGGVLPRWWGSGEVF